MKRSDEIDLRSEATYMRLNGYGLWVNVGRPGVVNTHGRDMLVCGPNGSMYLPHEGLAVWAPADRDDILPNRVR